MPCPEPQVWRAIINRTSTLLEESVLKLFAFRHIHLSICWGAVRWDRPRALREMRPELSLTVRKRGVKSVNDWPTSLDEVWNWPPMPPHSTVFQYAVHLAEPLKDFPPGMWLILLWGTEWIIVQVCAPQTSTGNDLFSIHDISCFRYCYVNINHNTRHIYTLKYMIKHVGLGICT